MNPTALMLTLLVCKMVPGQFVPNECRQVMLPLPKPAAYEEPMVMAQCKGRDGDDLAEEWLGKHPDNVLIKKTCSFGPGYSPEDRNT